MYLDELAPQWISEFKTRTYFVWLPLATKSPSLFVNFMDVKASVLPTWILLAEPFPGLAFGSD